MTNLFEINRLIHALPLFNVFFSIAPIGSCYLFLFCVFLPELVLRSFLFFACQTSYFLKTTNSKNEIMPYHASNCIRDIYSDLLANRRNNLIALHAKFYGSKLHLKILSFKPQKCSYANFFKT